MNVSVRWERGSAESERAIDFLGGKGERPMRSAALASRKQSQTNRVIRTGNQRGRGCDR